MLEPLDEFVAVSANPVDELRGVAAIVHPLIEELRVLHDELAIGREDEIELEILGVVPIDGAHEGSLEVDTPAVEHSIRRLPEVPDGVMFAGLLHHEASVGRPRVSCCPRVTSVLGRPLADQSATGGHSWASPCPIQHHHRFGKHNHPYRNCGSSPSQASGAGDQWDLLCRVEFVKSERRSDWSDFKDRANLDRRSHVRALNIVVDQPELLAASTSLAFSS